MQNLSFQSTQNTPLKNLAEPIKKNDTSIESSSTGETANTPFQLMLSKQLQAQAKQGSEEHLPVEHNIKSKANNVKVTNIVAKQLEVNDNSKVDLKANLESDPAINLNVASTGQDGLDPVTSIAKKEDVDNKSEVTAIDSLGTNASVVAPIMQPIAIEKAQVAAVSLSNFESQKPSKLEAVVRNRQDITTGLSNLLSQAKNTNPPNKDAGNTQSTGDHGEVSLNQDRWSDVAAKQSAANVTSENKGVLGAFKDGALSSVAGQAINNESSKLALSAVKESIIKDTAAKGMVIPANYQLVTQMNATMPIQQAGSTNSINACPGKTGWDQAISQKVVWMVGAGEQSATLTLNPPDLGPLQVVINVHNDKADTTFISNNAEVRQALQDGMANLREKMGESGIRLGQANVSSGGQPQQDFQQATQNRSALQFNDVPAQSLEKPANVSTLVRVANGLVDTFV
jgi:flagellar hook-length control protein FliK